MTGRWTWGGTVAPPAPGAPSPEVLPLPDADRIDLRTLCLHEAWIGTGLGGLLPDDLFVVGDNHTPAPSIAVNASSRGALTSRSHDSTHDGVASLASPDPDRLPRPGAVLDKYRIEAELGRGGFAVVYRATHLLMRTPVAVKLLLPWVLDRHPQLAEHLCEEARFTSLVDHPNVVRIFDVTADTRWTYIVMELCDGTSLGRMLGEGGALDPLPALRITRHVAAGLEAALAQGLVHRDIKPGNILITAMGQTKIVDFGLARRADQHAPTAEDDAAAGRISGTPAYIAPEQVRDPDGADHRADIYALGATLFHALAGRPPFEGGDAMELIRCHLHELPPDLHRLRPELPQAVCALVHRMLAKDPVQRPATYDQLSAELQALERDLMDRSPDEHGSSRRFLRRITTMFRR